MSSVFAPVYHPTPHQQTFLTRQQKLQSKKRKRGEEDPSDDGEPQRSSPSPDPTPRASTSTYRPVNRTDPYHIAGLSREASLPLPPFPHAAIKDPPRAEPSLDEQLAALNPPLYLPASTPEDKSTSLKRRHLDNLTTVLHRCMLRGDWARATRAWSILIRTEIAGRGIDIRRHGRWGVGAELLMRRGGGAGGVTAAVGGDDVDDDDDASGGLSPFTDEGFQLARQYYERLILQYPHTALTQHTVNAAVFYPALFNIWVYEVQDRAKRARRRLRSKASSARNESDDDDAQPSPQDDDVAGNQVRQIQLLELDQALPIAQRMDELLLGPPYDSDRTLLELRGMVALWISDLHIDMAELPNSDLDTSFGSDDTTSPTTKAGEQHRRNATLERQKARDIFTGLMSLNVNLPDNIVRFVRETSNV